MKLCTTGLILCLPLLLFALPHFARAEVTATYAYPTGGGSYGSFGKESSVQARGQVFQAEVSGDLASVSFRGGRDTGYQVDLVLSVYAEEGGLPTGNPLASRTVPFSGIQENGAGRPMGADFTGSGVTLEAGTRYVIVATLPVLDPDESYYFLNGIPEAQADYSGGDSCFLLPGGWQVGGTAWSFQVEVGESTPTRDAPWGSIKREFLDRPAGR